MLSQLHSYLSQPMLMDCEFAESLLKIAESSNMNGVHASMNGLKAMFSKCESPVAAVENQIMSAKSVGTKKAVCLLPIYGPIQQHADFISDFMGGCVLDDVAKAFDMAMSDSRVSSILLDIHSPGGQAFYVKEMADKIHNARGQKPICSIANSMMASAAYWIGSAADRVYASPSAKVGSVGVYQLHIDQSHAMEKAGVKATIARIPAGKADGNPFEPLSDEASAAMALDVAEIYDAFTSSLATYWGTTQQKVQSDFGGGRTVSAQTGVKQGMITRVATRDEVLARLGAGTIRPGTPASQASAEEWDIPRMDCRDASLLRRKMAIGDM